MTVLVVGASGATGQLLVEQLLIRNITVKIIVRSQSALPENFKNRSNLTIIRASILELSDAEIAKYVNDCDAVASCLGHNLSMKGIYGHPRKLVVEATRRLCEAIIKNKPEKSVKFILMNSAGNSIRGLDEPVSFLHKCIFAIIRLILPPHVDNEQAADFLRNKIGQNHPKISWVVVRPDSLIDAEEVTEYQAHQSPIRSVIFNPGQTSRINVAHFMADMITDTELWEKWQGQLPVLYNKEPG